LQPCQSFLQRDSQQRSVLKKALVLGRESLGAPVRRTEPHKLAGMRRDRDLKLGVQREDTMPMPDVAVLRDDLPQPRPGVLEQQPPAPRVDGERDPDITRRPLCECRGDPGLSPLSRPGRLEEDVAVIGRNAKDRRPGNDVELMGLADDPNAALP
jgi:hypothetical protein